jgi:hypothetical protein
MQAALGTTVDTPKRSTLLGLHLAGAPHGKAIVTCNRQKIKPPSFDPEPFLFSLS